MIASALLQTSRGARPSVTVVYGLNDVDNKNELECYINGFRQSGANYTVRNPDTERIERNIIEPGSSYRFTIQPMNESLVSCKVGDSEESERVKVVGM